MGASTESFSSPALFNSRILAVICALFPACFSLPSIAGELSAQEQRLFEERPEVPKNATLPSPLTAPQTSSIDGKLLYRRLCEECHGESGEAPQRIVGLFSRPPHDLRLLSELSRDSRNKIKRVIREGSGQNMLPFRDRLTEAQIDAVANYVLQLQGRATQSGEEK